MTGAVLAAASGLGFGVFQSLNRRAVADLDVELATFLQLVIATAVLIAAAAATGSLDDLADVPAAAIAWFVAGGLVHFFVGWTLLNASQKRIGAARTSPLIAATPMFGVAVAFVTLGEAPRPIAWAGIVLISAGAYWVGFARVMRTHAGRSDWRDPLAGIGTAVAWAVSPVLIRKGLDTHDTPLLGLALGLVASVAAYGIALAARRRKLSVGGTDSVALSFKLVAGGFVALSTWGRWAALDLTTIGVVLALGLLSVPVVLTLSPAVMGRHVEQVTRVVWAGAGLVVVGSLLLIARNV